MRISFRENLIPSKPYSVGKDADKLTDEKGYRGIFKFVDKLINVELGIMSNS